MARYLIGRSNEIMHLEEGAGIAFDRNGDTLAIRTAGAASTLDTLLDAVGWLHNEGTGVFVWSTPTKTDVGLGNVLDVAQEPALGNPGVDGEVLVSTVLGVRSWTGTAAIDITGTAAKAAILATARAINGTDFDGSAPITVPVNNANDATNADDFVLFTATQAGNYAALTSAGLKYHPSTGILTATGFAGPLTGNVTGDVSGTAANVTGVVALANGGVGFDASGIAKGGIISGTGAGTAGITAVGADGEVLTADAASAGGVKWAAGPASATVDVTDDTTTNASMYPTWVVGAGAGKTVYVSTTKLSFNPSTGLVTMAGGLTAGSGAVGIIGSDGRIPAISSTYFASLSGANLTGIVDGALSANVALLNAANLFTNNQTITKTTEQFRLRYDASNYDAFTVGSTGSLTIAATGTNPNITLTPGGTGIVAFSANQQTSFGSASLVSARMRNTTNAASAFAGFLVANDTDANLGGFFAFSSGYTTVAGQVANGITVQGNGAGGIALYAGANSAVIDFVTTTAGGVATLRGTVKGTGIWQMQAYGAGAATFDASGNISSVSDECLKTLIRPFARGLSALKGIVPITHKYSADSGLDTVEDYTQFSAQNVMKCIPEAVYEKNGVYSFYDRAILATLVNATNELATRYDDHETRLLKLEGRL